MIKKKLLFQLFQIHIESVRVYHKNYRIRHLSFFLTSAYFVNGKHDLTDNLFYPSAERIWLCIRLNNAGKWACDRLTEDDDFGKKKKIIFSGEAHFDLGGYVNKQNCRIWGTENIQNESLFGADFGP